MEDSQLSLDDLRNELQALLETTFTQLIQDSIDLDSTFQQIIEENYWDLF